VWRYSGPERKGARSGLEVDDEEICEGSPKSSNSGGLGVNAFRT
jgi:hypothetical protein